MWLLMQKDDRTFNNQDFDEVFILSGYKGNFLNSMDNGRNIMLKIKIRRRGKVIWWYSLRNWYIFKKSKRNGQRMFIDVTLFFNKH